VARRHGDYALVGVAAVAQGESVMAGYVSVSDTPVVVDLTGLSAAEAGEVALRQLDPATDIHATADYRAQLVRVLTARVVEAVTGV
jgi:carbon-monoxide dehydrogenase medium subunit